MGELAFHLHAKQVQCSLDFAGEFEWWELQLLLKLVDEVNLPLESLQLPSSERKGEEGDNPDDDHGWGDPSFFTRLVERWYARLVRPPEEELSPLALLNPRNLAMEEAEGRREHDGRRAFARAFPQRVYSIWITAGCGSWLKPTNTTDLLHDYSASLPLHHRGAYICLLGA